MSADILFRRPFDPAARDIVFGQQEGAAQEDASGRLFVTLPPAGGISVAGRLQYDNAVSRSDVIGAGAGWASAVPVSPAAVTAVHEDAAPVQQACRSAWSLAVPLVSARRPAWRAGERLRASAGVRWGRGDALSHRSASARWQAGDPLPHLHRLLSELAVPTPAVAGGHWQTAHVIPASLRRLRSNSADPMAHVVAASAGPAAPVAIMLQRIRWGWAEPLPPGRSVIIVTPPPEPWRCYTPPPGDAANLLFDERLTPGADILFRCGKGTPAGALVVPTLKVYIVINSASLTRVSNNLPIPVTGQLRIAIDADSAHWTWSTTTPLRAIADLEPNAPGELVELEAVINGATWRLLVESKREAERFGQASLQIGGRGVSAEISDPAYPVVSHDNASGAANAQQLAAAALMINGVPIGWSLDWQAADWLVPAGVWVHSGTPLQSVARIAEAAGAYVQPSASGRTLRVLPRYPVAPWEWGSAAPAVVMPADAVLERGAEHISRADYNAVYVSGEEGGILARIKRAGSAGDRAAQMVVDRLVTHPDAARGRGVAVLGNTGAQQFLTLETGILPASGVIHVGTLMDWTRGTDTRRGLVRSLSVTASPSSASGGPLIVRQTLGVETHG